MSRELDIRQRALTQLRRHAHQILAAGYALLTPGQYANWKEPDITGELCRAMSEYMESDAAPSWITSYALRDDPKLNVDGKLGESRPRIDIELERVQRGPRPKFRFEAKRLGKDHPLSDYLGSEGLGAFLSNYYPLTHDEAGMLGYVQKNDIPYWVELLRRAIGNSVSPGFSAGTLTPVTIVKELSTWRSGHTRSDSSELFVWHTFLLFC